MKFRLALVKFRLFILIEKFSPPSSRYVIRATVDGCGVDSQRSRIFLRLSWFPSSLCWGLKLLSKGGEGRTRIWKRWGCSSSPLGGGRNCRFCCLGREPIYPLLFTTPSGDSFIVGSSSNDDGDGNEYGKKTTILHVHHAFFAHFFAVTEQLRR